MTLTVLLLVIALLLAVFSFTPWSSGKPLLAVSVILTIVSLLVASMR